MVPMDIIDDHFESSVVMEDPLNVSWDDELDIGINRETSKNNLFAA
jgi:hypothetical protein